MRAASACASAMIRAASFAAAARAASASRTTRAVASSSSGECAGATISAAGEGGAVIAAAASASSEAAACFRRAAAATETCARANASQIWPSERAIARATDPLVCRRLDISRCLLRGRRLGQPPRPHLLEHVRAAVDLGERGGDGRRQLLPRGRGRRRGGRRPGATGLARDGLGVPALCSSEDGTRLAGGARGLVGHLGGSIM
jgi:hypothetical protein